jgi:hypothetical protein
MTEYLTSGRRLPPGFDADTHLARLDEDGFTILENYMSEDQLTRFREGLKPYLGMYRGRNPFEGLATERVYTLVGRGKVYQEIASDGPPAAHHPRRAARAQLPAERRPCDLHLPGREGAGAAFR